MSVQISAKPETASRTLASDAVGILVPLLILAVGAGFLAYSVVNRPKQVTSPEEVVIPKVTTVIALPFQDNFEIDVDGVVVPHREIKLPTEVAGRIVHRAEQCRTGRFVRADEVLFRIDPTDYELEIQRLEQEQQQAELKIRETKVDLASTRRQLELAERDVILQKNDVARMTLLSKRGGVADAEVDRALRAQITSKNALETLQGRVSLLTAQLESARTTVDLTETKLQVARLNLRRTEIRSPLNGVVVEEMVEVNSFVQKGTTLVAIEDTSAVEVLCNLRTDQIAWLWRAGSKSGVTEIGDQYKLPPVPADVVFQVDGAEYVWNGVVSRYDGIGLDPKTRTIPCRILVSGPTDIRLRATPDFSAEGSTAVAESDASVQGGPTALVRGMYVDVRIHAPTTSEEILQVPIEAVRPGGTLWVIKDNKLEVRKANVAKTLTDHVLVRSDGTDIGLDERIIITPLPAATAGMELVEEISTSR